MAKFLSILIVALGIMALLVVVNSFQYTTSKDDNNNNRNNYSNSITKEIEGRVRKLEESQETCSQTMEELKEIKHSIAELHQLIENTLNTKTNPEKHPLQEKIEQEKMEVEKEKLEIEKEKIKQEREKLEKEKAENAKLEKEKAENERTEKEKAEKQKADKEKGEKADKDKIDKQKPTSIEKTGEIDEEEEREKEKENEETETPINNNKERKRAFFGILASYKNRDRRDAMRETMLKMPQREDWAYKFILGATDDKKVREAAEQENEEFGDIIFNPQVDSYYNISYKVLHLAKYAIENYDIDYMVKIDDDSFVMIDRLLDATEGFAKEKFYGGIVLSTYNPSRNKGDIWYMPEDLFPRSSGPAMATGPGYVLSKDCATMIATTLTKQNKERPVLPLEDVNTAVIMEDNHVSPKSIGGFLPGSCPCQNDMILSHWCTPNHMKSFYTNLVDKNKLC